MRMAGDWVAEVVVAGHLTLDLFPDLTALPSHAFSTPGRLFQVGGMRVTTGGSVGNTGLALHQLGLPVRLIATVGDDVVGESTIAWLRRTSPSLADTITTREGAASAYTIVLSQPGIDRTFLHCTGANDAFSAEDIPLSLVIGARWFHFGYPSLLPALFADEGRALAGVLAQARKLDAVTSLDFTLPDPATPSGRVRWPEFLRHVLPETDVFVPSLEELVYLLRRDWYEQWAGHVVEMITRAQIDSLAAEVLRMGPAIAGVKLGADGILLYGGSAARLRLLDSRLAGISSWADRIIGHAAFAVEVQGTTGAGDVAYAALIAALLRGQSPQTAARLMCAAGAASVERPDAVSNLRAWDALLSRFHNWPARPSQWINESP
jgi:sugar/nucleoside kinase (ribokinase family)